jgi:hypothetical protein
LSDAGAPVSVTRIQLHQCAGAEVSLFLVATVLYISNCIIYGNKRVLGGRVNLHPTSRTIWLYYVYLIDTGRHSWSVNDSAFDVKEQKRLKAEFEAAARNCSAQPLVTELPRSKRNVIWGASCSGPISGAGISAGFLWLEHRMGFSLGVMGSR